VIAVAIVGILATLIAPALGPLQSRAERVVCMGHLRAIYAAENSYLDDYQGWPQPPAKASRQEFENYWKETLKIYGISDDTWICPTFKRGFTENPQKYSNYPTMHYMPAQFDQNPLTPRKWAGMPWAIEIGDFHATGNLLIRTDGAIKGMNDLFREAGVGNGGGKKVLKLN